MFIWLVFVTTQYGLTICGRTLIVYITRAIYSRVDSPGLGSDLVVIGADVDEPSITAKTHKIASLKVTMYGSRQ